MDRARVRYWVGRAVLTALGWKEEGEKPRVPRCVLVAAPHTTNWDLPVSLGLAYVLGIDVKWVGKHTLFEGYKGPFFRWLGGVSVDRTGSKDQVQQLADYIKSQDEVILMIAPEGTRGRAKYWKSGFYYIALAADVPIALSFVDYKRRRGGIGPVFKPSGKLEEDVARIRDFYQGVTARYPEQFGNIEFRPEGERAERPPRRGKLAGVLHGIGWRRPARLVERLGLG